MSDATCRSSARIDPGALLRRSTSKVLPAARWLPVIAIILIFGACDSLLDVDNPDITQPGDLEGETGLEVLRMGAFGDFTVAYSGGAGQVLYAGTLADEIMHVGPFIERSQIDAQRVEPDNRFLPDLYSDLHRARRAAEAAAEAWADAGDLPGSATALAEMNSLAGYTYIFFGENFCSGVPFSRTTSDGQLEFGDVSTREEVFSTAISRFDQALARANDAGDADLSNLARIGKARALLNTGAVGEAAEVASAVATEWEWVVRHSTNTDRQANGVMEALNISTRWAVANLQGGGLDYRDAFEAGDPRTPWVEGGAALVPDFTTYHQLKYPERDAPIVLASGVEARLIEAEAALVAGNTATFEQIHNALRSRLDAPAVGPIDAGTMGPEQRVDFHFRERALWLWLTGHRHGDMRRLVRQYDRGVDDVFATGSYHMESLGSFGERVVFPVPNVERNNPALSDRESICETLTP